MTSDNDTRTDDDARADIVRPKSEKSGHLIPKAKLLYRICPPFAGLNLHGCAFG